MNNFNQIQSQTIRLNSIPAVLVYNSLDSGLNQGTILVWHGLGSCKERQEKELYSLARAGFLAVGIDACDHGERRPENFEQRFSIVPGEFEINFIDTVRRSAAEITDIIDALILQELAVDTKIGALGISMGGFIIYRALLNDLRLRAAAALLGSPNWPGAEDSPHLWPERFCPAALLVQTAAEDQSVPPAEARNFHQTLIDFYQSENQNRLKYVEFPAVGHFMPEDDWNCLWNNTVDWFKTFLI